MELLGKAHDQKIRLENLTEHVERIARQVGRAYAVLTAARNEVRGDTEAQDGDIVDLDASDDDDAQRQVVTTWIQTLRLALLQVSKFPDIWLV
jgi:hypothetical protein